MEQAIVYYQKSIELEKKAGTRDDKGSFGLVQSYVKMGRVGEALKYHKNLYAELGGEHIQPDYILKFGIAL